MHRSLWLIPTILVVVDQITKWSVATFMQLYQSVPVMGDWFRLTYIHNPGGAFGVRWGHQGLYFAAAIIVIGWICWHLWRHGSVVHLSTLALALILGGAFGNLIDRVILGEVIDFLDFEFPDMRIPQFDFGIIRHPGVMLDRWPIFNIADSAVTVGVLALVVSLFYDPRMFGPAAMLPVEAESGDQGTDTPDRPPAAQHDS
ncbi:MAG: signal peptidase II [Candidatus Zixiibacteriota bacterium]